MSLFQLWTPTRLAGASTTTDPSLVLLCRIDIHKGPLIRDREIAGRRRVRAHDRLRAGDGVGMADRIEQGAIDEQRMAVSRAGRWPHHGKARRAIMIDHGANCRS